MQRGVVVVDVAGLDHLGEGRQRGRSPQLGIEVAVHQLEQLHGELDVADAARPPLELPLGQPLAGDLGLAWAFMARSERSSSAVKGWFQSQRWAASRPGADRGVAGHGPGLQQRLELPGFGPLVPVRLVGVERAHERAVAALGRRSASTRKQRRAISITARARRSSRRRGPSPTNRTSMSLE